jgi:hypothetical protein
MLVNSNPLESNKTSKESGGSSDSNVPVTPASLPATYVTNHEIIHGIVFFLAKKNPLSPPAASFDELHSRLIGKHAGLSKTVLQSVITDNPKIFLSDAEGKIGLRERNDELVRTYFEMSDDVAQAINSKVEAASYSLTKPCLITFSRKQALRVKGLVCKCEDVNSVLFQFANNIEYEIQHALQGDFVHGQMMRSVLYMR